MMRNSTIPEIAALAKTDFASDDYWNDTSDNIQVLSGKDGDATQVRFSTLRNDENRKPARLLLSAPESTKQDLISPGLTYDYKNVLALSSNAFLTGTDFAGRQKVQFFEDKNTNGKSMKDNLEKRDAISECQFKPPVMLQRSVISQ